MGGTMTSLAGLAARPGTVAVRMLGPLHVSRGDGSVVSPQEWRTGKTADLVRILALQAGDPVATEVLLAALWPGSDQQHGKASLRTAASRLRHVLGGGCLERTMAGLRLCNTWTDVFAFRTLAAEVRNLMDAGELGEVPGLARQADALYRGDLRAHDDGSDWAQHERRNLALAYQSLLCDAADATAACGPAREALDFARRAQAVDLFSERACRALMRAYAELGELPQALREYERCRALLLEELGVDPAAETQALHVRLLRSESPRDRLAIPRSQPPVASGQQGSALPGAASADATATLQLALTVCLPQRQFERARRCADQVADSATQPALRARAIAASALPDALFGRPEAARLPLERAVRLARESGERRLCRRLAVLRCLVAHDLDRPEFGELWADAAASCERETDVNWSWLMIRVATERGDLAGARLATRLPVRSAAGPLARTLHALATATLLAEIGQADQAIERLRDIVAVQERGTCALLLPEALARLATLLAERDPAAAQDHLARLGRELGREAPLPREAFLQLLAAATLDARHKRPASAAAAAANAAALAERNGLHVLSASAHAACARYTARAQARAAAGSLKLALILRPIGAEPAAAATG